MQRHWKWRPVAILTWLVLALLPLSVSALDLQLRQLKHRSWSLDDGVPEGNTAIAQLPDGRLLLGGEALHAFDGLTFERLPVAQDTSLFGGISSILAMPDGTAWAGYRDGKVAQFKDGILSEVQSPTDSGQIREIVASPDGAIWFQSAPLIEQPVVRFHKGSWRTFTPHDGLPQDQLIDIHAAKDGRIWVTSYRDAYVLEPSSQAFRRYETNLLGHGALSEDREGRIWLSDDRGTRIIFSAGRPACSKTFATPRYPRNAEATFAADGSLWGSTREGLFRLSAGQISRCAAGEPVDRYHEVDGLSSDRTYAMLNDREGAMWVVTASGIDQFRYAPIVPEPLLTRAPRYGYVLLSAPDGSVYVGAADAIYRVAPLGNPKPILTGGGEVEIMCILNNGNVLVGLPTRMVRIDGDRIESLPRPPAGPTGLYACAQDRRDRIWVASAGEGLFEWTQDHWQQRFEISGERFHPVLLAPYDGGVLLYHGQERLTAYDPPVQRDIPRSTELALQNVQMLAAKGDGVLVAGGFGLARLSGRQEVIRSSQTSWLRNVTGIGFAHDGTTWMLGGSGLVRLAPGALERAFSGEQALQADRILFGLANEEIQLFDRNDGLPGRFQPDGKRDVVIGGDGRVWMLTTAGVAWLDPASLPRNLVEPGVRITDVSANGVRVQPSTSMVLSSGVRRLEIKFSVASLSVPGRGEVRYRLSGIDEEWVSADRRRTATYTNLAPGSHTFEIIAANNDGFWNREGARLTLAIPPTFVESTLFKVLCALAVLALTWIAYRMRLYALSRRMAARMEARMAERERIARELHDTLLQGFQGLLLRFQAVFERMDVSQPQRPMLESALDRAEAVLVEGRDKIRQLRSEDSVSPLSDTLAAIGGEAIDHRACDFSVSVEGTEVGITPLAKEEIVAISGEAIRNAARHAEARRIECTLRYTHSAFLLLIKDDGIGIPGELLEIGAREGHYGLAGMRERAGQLGAEFRIASAPDEGTQITLKLSGRLAYGGPATRLKKLLQQWKH